jgi:hypothetical protein
MFSSGRLAMCGRQTARGSSRGWLGLRLLRIQELLLSAIPAVGSSTTRLSCARTETTSAMVGHSIGQRGTHLSLAALSDHVGRAFILLAAAIRLGVVVLIVDGGGGYTRSSTITVIAVHCL